MTNSICNYLFLLTCYSAFWGIWMFLHFPEGFAMCRTPPFSCLLVCVFADSVLHWFDRWSQRCGFFRSHLGPSTALTVFTVTTTYVANGKIQTFVLLLLSAAEDVCGILPDEISLGKLSPCRVWTGEQIGVVVIISVVIREQVWSLYSARFCMAVRRCHRLREGYAWWPRPRRVRTGDAFWLAVRAIAGQLSPISRHSSSLVSYELL